MEIKLSIKLHNLSSGFSRHHPPFLAREGIIICEIVFFSVSFCVSGNRTCSDIKRFYPRTPSDSYVIDPDGEGGEKPFKVYCNMTNKHGIGVTVISHDSESRTLVDGFDGHGSYSRSVIYNETSLIQLASLAASSAH